MTKEVADALVRHHMEDFDEYARQGFWTSAVLSLKDAKDVLEEVNRPTLRVLWHRYSDAIRARLVEARRFPQVEGPHPVPSIPNFAHLA